MFVCVHDYKSLCAVVTICITVVDVVDPELNFYILTAVTSESISNRE